LEESKLDAFIFGFFMATHFLYIPEIRFDRWFSPLELLVRIATRFAAFVTKYYFQLAKEHQGFCRLYAL
jgi:hypothetical protein